MSLHELWAFCGFWSFHQSCGSSQPEKECFIVWHSWVTAGPKNTGDTFVHRSLLYQYIVKINQVISLPVLKFWNVFFLLLSHLQFLSRGWGRRKCRCMKSPWFLVCIHSRKRQCAGCSRGHWSFGNMDAFVRSTWFLCWKTAVHCKQCSPAYCLFRFLRSRI